MAMPAWKVVAAGRTRAAAGCSSNALQKSTAPFGERSAYLEARFGQQAFRRWNDDDYDGLCEGAVVVASIAPQVRRLIRGFGDPPTLVSRTARRHTDMLRAERRQ
jgi:hypothetical protein